MLGLAFPPVLAAAMALLGLPLPWTAPSVLGLGLGVAMFFVPDLDLRRRAGEVRADLRYVLCVYLELVALERAADAGAAEALERAAAVGDSRFFVLVRDELVRAQLAGEPAWHAFERLAERVELVELRDVADIMRLTGEDGAAVYSTLRARAASLRSALLNEQAARANAASEQMVVPVALLGIAFLLPARLSGIRTHRLRMTHNPVKENAMNNLAAAALVAVRGQTSRLRRLARRRRSGHTDAGVSTLEMVIIALGLMAVAGLLVAAVTAAVTTRTNQLRVVHGARPR